MQLKTEKRYYRLDRKKISFVKFILEAYDNTAYLTTLDANKAVIKIVIAPGCTDIMDHVIKDLSKQFFMERLTDSAPAKG